jgi:DNA polymerase-3 subunit gamma/tau
MAEPPTGDAEPTPADPVYQSLYRRFRPQRFADVRGQEHVTRALLNTVRDGRVAHAYLFSGPRGTGKTSTARILAMALNCAHPVDGEPDGTCASCVDIRKGVSTDVQELDAASNRRIDEMRDLLSRVALGTRGRWKVYIIDEVHQLTGDAASALLKTLEEPPAHVVFVLATTDPQKVMPTIRSRTIPFDFHLLPSEVLGDLLRDINVEAGLGVAPEAIDLVVRRGHGSARDALTVLDQVAAGGGGEDPAQVVSQIVDGLAERDVGLVLTAVAEGMAAGRDARRLAADLLDHLRNGFLATMARGLVMLPDDAVTEVAEQARRLGLAALVRAMEVIGQALADMRDSVDPRVTLEVALVRLARPDADVSPAALLERIERLERAARAGEHLAPGTAAGSRADGAERAAPPGPPPSPPRAAVPPPPALPPRSSATAESRTGTTPRPPRASRASGAPPGPPSVPGSNPSRPPSAPESPRSSVPVSPSVPGVNPSGVPSVPGVKAATAPPSASRVEAPAAVAAAPGGFSPDASLPSRDELTKAWGDGLLRALSGKARAYLQSGRFVGVDPDGAVFALPNQQWLTRSLDARSEVEAALAARFGRPVPLKLVLESDGTAAPAGAPPPEDHFEAEDVDLDHLQDAEVEVMSPEQRLMDAFPGAEEVST